MQQNSCTCKVYNQQFALIKNKTHCCMFRLLTPDLDIGAIGETCGWSTFCSWASAVLHYCQPDCTASVRQSASRRNLRSYTISICCSSWCVNP